MWVTRSLVLAAVGVAVLVSAGCTSCPRKAYAESLRPVEEVVAIAPARARVNVFLMNGLDPLQVGGLPCLKEQILAAGFPKVYYAQRYDREWYRRELHRLHREDPAGENADLTNAAFPSLLIRSQSWRLSPYLQPTESLTIHGFRHPGVNCSPATVQQVMAILADSARRVPIYNRPVRCVPVLDPKKPVPRPELPKVMPPLPPEWRFLCPSGT